MKIKKNSLYNLFNIVLVCIIIWIISNFFSMKVTRYSIDVFVIITFFVILFLSIFNIIKDKTPFSLNKTYWYFNIIFFFIAPFCQYMLNFDIWGYKYRITDYYYLKTNIFIIIGMFVHQLFYGKNIKLIKFGSYNFSKKIKFKFILLFLAISCFFVLSLNVGFSNLFSRVTNSAELSGNSMFNTIFTCLLKIIPVYIFTYFYSRNNKNKFINFCLFVIIFILNFPVSTTRFWMGAIFIGIFLLTFVKDKKKSRVYDIILILIFTVIFPITYLFKFNTLDNILESGLKMQNLVSSYYSVDYDAYSIFARSIKFVDDHDIVYGQQLIGTVLFFIPRSIWPDKPEATGAFIAKSQYQSFTNISCPFMAEGYINFGIVGLILFEIIMSLVCRKLDEKYWHGLGKKYLYLIYPYLIGFLLFYERGALHHAVVYTFCLCLPLLFIYIFNLFFRKKGDENAF